VIVVSGEESMARRQFADLPEESGQGMVEAVIERLTATRAVVDRHDHEHALFPVAITPAEGQALRGWIERERATNTAEIGLAYAFATLHIVDGLLANASGARTVSHTAVDPFQTSSFAGLGRQHLAEAGVADLVEVHEEESQLVLPRMVAEGRSFDFAFVDGNHRFDRVFLDLVYLGRLLRPGAVAFVDDVQLPAIGRATEFFTSNRNWKVEERSAADPEHQWVVLRTPMEPDDRGFADFCDFSVVP
jgi:predicted O-methyltransferase YrrM